MKAVTDARLQTSFPGHPKTKRLERALGAHGPWSLVKLILWAAGNRSDGDLSGLTDDDIEMAVDWPGELGSFVATLVACSFLDGNEGSRVLHDWDEHNRWASGAEARSKKAQWNATKRHHGEAEADRLVPGYRAVSTARSNENSNASSNAPLPSPSPSKRDTPPKKPGGQPSMELKTFIAQCQAQGTESVPEDDPVFAYAESIGLPIEYVALAWSWFKVSMEGKRKKDWRAHFRKAVRGNWPKYWYSGEHGWALTTAGIQAERERTAEEARA